jgi:hypothetical protein
LFFENSIPPSEAPKRRADENKCIREGGNLRTKCIPGGVNAIHTATPIIKDIIMMIISLPCSDLGESMPNFLQLNTFVSRAVRTIESNNSVGKIL